MSYDLMIMTASLVSAIVVFFWLRHYRPLLPATMWIMLVLAWVSLSTAVVSGVYGDWLQAGYKLTAGVVFVAVYYWYYHKSFTEQVVLVDEYNNPLRVAAKLPTHNADTPLHRAFSIFIFNNKGETLLQQRALHKKTWPGVWSNSCCGHVMLYQSNAHAARRRLKYELGLSGIKLYEILPDYRYCAEKDGIVENEFCPVFVGFIKEQIPVLNPQEVNAIKWVPWSEFLQSVSSVEHGFSPWAMEEARLLEKTGDFQKLYTSHAGLHI